MTWICVDDLADFSQINIHRGTFVGKISFMISDVLEQIQSWLVVWNIVFPYIGNDNPNWLIFFREVETTYQKVFTSYIWDYSVLVSHVF
jgi:hypothetical protein